MMPPSEPVDIPHVIAPPPLLYAVPLAIGLALNHFLPLAALPAPWPRRVGILFFVLGFVGLPAIIAFARAKTSPRPWRPSSALVVTGAYRISRNPMYLGFTFFYISAALWFNTLWPIFFLPIVLVVMTRGVVVREEAYLARRFGEPYRAYLTQVRRWL